MHIDSVIFYSKDVDKTAQFYMETLQFTKAFAIPGKFAQFKLTAETSLGIKQQVEDREVPGSQTVLIGVEKIEQLYRELQGRGIKFHKELTEESYGKEFSLLDPDGNKIQYITRT